MRRGLILILLTMGFVVVLNAFEPNFASRPAISPDGANVCFVYQGDLWVVPFKGGSARRLTSTSATEQRPLWSPDGRYIAFNSIRDGQNYIYIIAANGGTARPVFRESFWATDWYADGSAILASKWSYQYGTSLYRVPLDGTRPQLVVEIGDGIASLSPDNKRIIFNRRGYAFREAYKGSQNGDLWEVDIESKNYTRLTDTEYTERYPRYSMRSGSIFYAASDGERFQLYRVENKNFNNPYKLTNFPIWSVRNINIARENDRIVFECFNELWKYDPTAVFSDKVSKLNIDIPEDQWEDPTRLAIMKNDFQVYGVSDDELLVVFGFKYDLFAMPRKGGEAKRLSNDHAGFNQIAFLKDQHTAIVSRLHKGLNSLFKVRIDSVQSIEPIEWFGKDQFEISSFDRQVDGSWVISYKDERRGGRIAVADSSFSTVKAIDLGDVYAYNFALSPDPNFATYVTLREDNYIRDIYLYDFQSGESQKLINDDAGIRDFSWTPDLKSLLVVSSGNICRLDLVPRDAYEMETDHWKEILQKKPAPQTSDPKTEAETQKDAEPEENTESQDVEPTPVPDAETEEFEPAEAKEKEDEKPRLTIEWRDLEKRYFKIITTSNGYLTPLKMISDTTFYYFQENYFSEIPSYLKKANIYGGNIKEEFNFGKNTMAFKLVGSTIYYTSSGALKSYNYVTAKRGEINCSFDYSYDLSVLNRRVFEQVWGAFGQNFYDPDMHGQSWEKLYERYRPYVEKVVTIDDLSYIIDEMIGDVNASHTGFYPRTDKEQKYKRIASLGMDFDLSAELDEGLKIKNVFPRHRIYDFYKIRPNDLLLEIDGTRITKYTSVDSLLADKVGKRIRLKIKQGDSILDAQVDGIELWDQRELWYLKKTEDNRNKVSELSSGKLGYVHIPSMGYEDYTKFINDVFRFNSDKAGLVIDVRGNTGGWIHDLLVSFLSQRPYAYSTSRRMGFEKRIEPRRLWDKPTIVLVDENSFSDGEIFPTVYKELKLGKVVGYPSSGAVIGTSPYYLIDGSEMRMPGSGWFKLDGSNMEGTGAMPDIVIDHTPNDILAERDNQLQTAVEELLKEL